MVSRIGRLLQLGSTAIFCFAMSAPVAMAKGGHGGGGGHSSGGHHSSGSAHHSGGYAHHSRGYVHHGGGYSPHPVYTNHSGYRGGNRYWPNYYHRNNYGYGNWYPTYRSSYNTPTLAKTYVTNYAAVPNIGMSEQAVVDSEGAGAQIIAILPGSSAARAGLQIGDVMPRVNGYLIQLSGN